MRREVSTNMITSSLYVFCRACGSLHFTHHRTTERLVSLHRPAEHGLNGVLRVRRVFQQHQADLIDHARVPPVEAGHLLCFQNAHPGDHLLSCSLTKQLGNECKNQLRHWWRTRRADGTELDNLTWERPGDGELWELILTLPEHEKMALYLHYYQGYSTGETAELMGKNPSTVRSWLCRARRRLKPSPPARSGPSGASRCTGPPIPGGA